MSSKIEKQIEWRRRKIAEMDSKGYNQAEISSMMKVSIGTVNRDLAILRQQSRENIKNYVQERLPEAFGRCLTGLNSILKEAWLTSEKAESEREKLQALSLAKDCYDMTMQMLTNSSILEDAIRFVEMNANDKEEKQKAKSFGIVKEDIVDDIQGP